MTTLRIFLFGRFRIQCEERELDVLSARKVRELVCYLLLYRDRPHSREALAGLLWGEGSTARSKKYLRQALWQLQAAIDPRIEFDTGRLLLLEPEWVQINPQAGLWLDVAAFEQAFALAQGASGRELDAHRAQALQSAVELYQGNLLEGWYLDWCLYESERLQNMYLAMLDKLIDYCEAHQEYEAGLDYGTRILRYDRARERTHRRLMRLHYLAGNRTAALRQYARCVAALDEELGVGPAKRTVALHRQIQADRLDDTVSAPAEAGRSPVDTAAMLPEVLGHLKQIEETLADAQHQVQQRIQVVELTLNGQH